MSNLTDDEIDAAQSSAYQELVKAGYSGGMGGETWDRASARAIESAVLAKVAGSTPAASPTPIDARRIEQIMALVDKHGAARWNTGVEEIASGSEEAQSFDNVAVILRARIESAIRATPAPQAAPAHMPSAAVPEHWNSEGEPLPGNPLLTPAPDARIALQGLLDGIHQGRFVPVNAASEGYCDSLVSAGESALSALAAGSAAVVPTPGPYRIHYEPASSWLHAAQELVITVANDVFEVLLSLDAPKDAPPKIPENCGSGHCSCIECLKDAPVGAWPGTVWVIPSKTFSAVFATREDADRWQGRVGMNTGSLYTPPVEFPVVRVGSGEGEGT